MATNIKWELDSCLGTNEYIDFSHLYDQLIIENIDYILKYKNAILSFGSEYNSFLSVSRTIGLNIYGTDKGEKYVFKVNNVLDFIISGGIDIIKEHNSLIELKNNDSIFDNLSYG